MNPLNPAFSGSQIFPHSGNRQETPQEHVDMIFWASSYMHKSNIRFKKPMTAMNKQAFCDLAYSYYAEKLLKDCPNIPMHQSQQQFLELQSLAAMHKDEVSLVIYDDDKKQYLIENSSQYPVERHLLQGPWYFLPKKVAFSEDNRFYARFSISVDDKGYIPLAELLMKLMSKEHPLHKAIHEAKIYGSYFIGKSPEIAIIYLNQAEMSAANTSLFIDELKALDEFARPTPLGMRQISACSAYGEIPLNQYQTNSFGAYRSKVVVDAVNDFIRAKYSSLEEALIANYKKHDLNTEAPALVAN